MSAVLTMPNQEDELVRLLRTSIDTMRVEEKRLQEEIKKREEMLARLTKPYVGQPMHKCIRATLEEHGGTMEHEALVTEVVNRGAGFGARNPVGDAGRSITKMVESGALRIVHNKVSLVKK